MVQWATFAGITGVVLVLLLVLSHLTQTAFSDGDSTESRGADRPSARSTERPSSPSAVDSSDRDDPAEAESTSETGTRADPDAVSDASASSADAPDSSRGPSPSTPDPDGGGSFDADGDGDATADRTAAAERALDDPAARSPSPPARGDIDTGTGTDGEPGDRPRQSVDPASLSTGELLANVALSQGLFACVLLGAVVYTGVPAGALGVEFSTAYLREGVVLGTACGLVLYAANEVGAAAATHFGFDHDEQLRSLLAPDSPRGWLVLLTLVLPLIAGFEELLFRAALIGVVSEGFAVDPWLLAVGSSIAFAVGHGMQGSVGIVVTGLLGFVLASIFVVTGSLLVVVVAHYLINALEFAVHEGLEVDWAERLEGSESDGHS